MIRKIGTWVACCFMAGSLIPAHANADIMNVDVTGVDPQYQSYFLQAEAFWESRITGYSSALPRIVRSQLSKLQIVASTANIDGAGGILGQAGPTSVVRYSGGGRRSRPIAIATASQMQFDNDDMAMLLASGDLVEVIKHEMAHALGFGALWTDNGLLAANRFGTQNYVGAFALKEFRRETGNPFAAFVPVEQGGGGGTAGAHWDSNDPFFNQNATRRRQDLMIGFIDPGQNTEFVSETTWAAFADLWYSVSGINGTSTDDGIFSGPLRPTKWTGADRPMFFTAVPEPTSAGVLALGLMAGLGLGARRRRQD
jgi:hypothetical protein